MKCFIRSLDIRNHGKELKRKGNRKRRINRPKLYDSHYQLRAGCCMYSHYQTRGTYYTLTHTQLHNHPTTSIPSNFLRLIHMQNQKLIFGLFKGRPPPSPLSSFLLLVFCAVIGHDQTTLHPTVLSMSTIV